MPRCPIAGDANGKMLTPGPRRNIGDVLLSVSCNLSLMIHRWRDVISDVITAMLKSEFGCVFKWRPTTHNELIRQRWS